VHSCANDPLFILPARSRRRSFCEEKSRSHRRRSLSNYRSQVFCDMNDEIPLDDLSSSLRMASLRLTLTDHFPRYPTTTGILVSRRVRKASRVSDLRAYHSQRLLPALNPGHVYESLCLHCMYTFADRSLTWFPFIRTRAPDFLSYENEPWKNILRFPSYLRQPILDGCNFLM
jgi:hypothetical protein